VASIAPKRPAPVGEFPRAVGLGHADRAGPVARADSISGSGEEDPMSDVAAVGDGSQCGGAVETPIDLRTPVPANQPLGRTDAGAAVGAD